jgi:uncharacterized membrane protein YqgA involved in biofilm formation
MIASVINAVAVFLGSMLGLLFAGPLKKNERFSRIIHDGIGAFTILIGLKMAFETQRILYVAISIAIGGLLGELIRIERGIEKLGEGFHRLVSKGKETSSASQFADAYLQSSVLFCVGAMTVLGSMQAGIQGDLTLLLTKSVMDTTMAILLAASLGLGVAFSAISILVIQGGITLFASIFATEVSPLFLTEISGVGGIMVLMIGLNLLKLKRISTANFLPAILIIGLLVAWDPLPNL